jgi:acyl carrier protein
MTAKKQVREFIVDHFLFGDDNALKDNTSLFEHSIVDSLGMMELITFIEETFKIKVQNDEMLPENLDSLNHIEAFLQKKMR